jgi:anaphase-promoting complex subunit 8
LFFLSSVFDYFHCQWILICLCMCRAAEQLVGIEQDLAKFTPSNTRFQRGSSSIRRRFRTNEIISTPNAGVSYVSTPVMEEDEVVVGDFYLLAKSYFDCREYRRAAHVLRDQTGKKSVFLRCYALYLVCCILF